MINKTALITGASSGIGKKLAYLCAQGGNDVILVARRDEKLELIKTDITQKFLVKVYVIISDLTETGAVATLMQDIGNLDLTVDILINNAGVGQYGLFHEGEWDKFRDMISLNVAAVTELTHQLLPPMIERGSGRVLNVASMAGFAPGPLQAVYYATKAYVLSFSEAIYNETRGTGVTVTALCPGPTQTEFMEHAGVEGVLVFKSQARPGKVAKVGYNAMMKGKRLAIPGLYNKLLALLSRVLPRWLVLKISRLMGEKI